jgi:hypothetical protein
MLKFFWRVVNDNGSIQRCKILQCKKKKKRIEYRIRIYIYNLDIIMLMGCPGLEPGTSRME